MESPRTGKYPPSSGKSSRSWAKLPCAQGGFGQSFSLKVKLRVYFCPETLESERSKRFAVSISLQSKDNQELVQSFLGTEKIFPLSFGKSSRCGPKSRCAQGGLGYSISLKVKWGYSFGYRTSKRSVQTVLKCLFHCKPRQSGVSLESPRLENIPQVPGNRAEVGKNHDARNGSSPLRFQS